MQDAAIYPNVAGWIVAGALAEPPGALLSEADTVSRKEGPRSDFIGTETALACWLRRSRRCLRRGERGTGRGRRGGGRGLRSGAFARLPSCRPLRWFGLKLADHRARIEGNRRLRGEVVAGMACHLHRHGQRLIVRQREGDAEALGVIGHRQRAGRLAARAERTGSVGPWRHRIDLELNRLRRWFEGIHRQGRTARQAEAGDRDNDHTAHHPPVLLRHPATDPARTIRGSEATRNMLPLRI